MAGKVEFTNLDKVFFPKAKITKGDLVEYYQSVAKFIMPYLKDHPCNLLRQPNGIDGEGFFQKEMGNKLPKWVKTKPIYSESNEAKINYFVCKDVDHLLYQVQLGCIEINPWNSRVQNLDKPDWIVIDLDPDDNPFSQVIETAKVVKGICDEFAIPCYPKTSGKTGMHIFIPMGAKYSYEQAKTFSQIIANMVDIRTGEFTSVVRDPAKRKGKIYVDFLQNRAGQTLAAPYSVRPTPQATVSTPLQWDEVNTKLMPTNFTIKNMQKRLDKVGDLWKPVVGKPINLKKILDKMG